MIAIASDHGGFVLKERLKAYLEEKGLPYEDFGCHSTESVDYPPIAHAAAWAVAEGRCQKGILVCTTGIGVAMAANRHRGIRCAQCADTYSAELTRRHNDANMLALAGGFMGPMLAEAIVEIFLNTPFAGGRHARRVAQIDEWEK